jgi:hypothetical protein
VLAGDAPVERLRLGDIVKLVEHPDCEHDFPPAVREAAYHFLDQHLR